ncbi:MAG: methyltransferase domain-containing protein [Alkalispirochaeta sp.]
MKDDVAEYYNRNTPSFLRFGRGSRRSGAIHRALWGPGVTSHAAAMDFVHERIIAAFRENVLMERVPPEPGVPDTEPPHPGTLRLADLGCGVGASMERISRALDATVSGVTLSSVQQALAAERLRSTPHRCRVLTGDFTDPGVLTRLTTEGLLHGIWMIEAYNHAVDGDALLAGIAFVLRPGGILAICDDFPDERLVTGPLTLQEERRRREFMRGWHVHTFWSPPMLRERAERHGLELVGSEDYSDYVAVDRPRDIAVRAIAGPARLLNFTGSWWDNIRGGNALQQLSKSGLIRYGMDLFRRR